MLPVLKGLILFCSSLLIWSTMYSKQKFTSKLITVLLIVVAVRTFVLG